MVKLIFGATTPDRIVMYEQHFGLKKRPFRANATGTDIFVGPHIATTMAALKKALTANDAIVSISGPVGSGKTTLVTRALESLGNNQKTVHVARMRLDTNDVLELLLDELGIEEKPNGTIQKFTLFRRHLKKLAENDERLFIAIEDGVRLGADTLAEIEALTAADAGESEGASILLMGDEALDSLLRETPLARIQQRIRQRLKIAALPVAEIRGYLRHCFRLAGRDFEQIFEANAAELLHHLSNGIPRIANNLVESAMTAAADQDLDRVATTLLARIAENEYGLSAADFDLEPQPVADAPEPLLIPELVQDTLPDLATLAPELAAAPEEIKPVPEWDRDPTMAELRPDLAALEQAMAFAQGDNREPAADVADTAEPLPVPEPEIPEVIPEITLDHAISQRTESKLIDEPGEVSAPAPAKASVSAQAPANDTNIPSLNLPPKQDKKADAEIERIATELAKAKSIEDIDDKLAETLFGDEINFVAARVLGNPPSGEPANDPHDGGMDLSVSQRLKTVRALNSDLHPSSREPEVVTENQAMQIPIATTESIEDQIDTSMTETLKALNVVPPVIDDDDDDEPKGGFFSHFKRS